VVITRAGGAVTIIDRGWVAVAATLSVTLMVKLEVPAVVGVPDITPVLAARVRPAGREPILTDQV
jgi:hypothetical protein